MVLVVLLCEDASHRALLGLTTGSKQTRRRDLMFRCLLQGMEMVLDKAVNFDKLQDTDYKRSWFSILTLTQPPQREP